MSDGADLNGQNHAASAGGAAVVAGAAVAATSASAIAQGAQGAVAAAAASAAAPLPAGALPFAAQAAVMAPAAAAAQAAAPHPSHSDADRKPRKKVAAKDAKRQGEDDQGKAPGDDEDQNLSQQVDTGVLPKTGEAAAPAPPASPAAAFQLVNEGGGGSSSGLVIGGGVLAAAGLGAMVLGGKGGGNDGDKTGVKNGAPTAASDTGAVNEGASLSGTVAANDTDSDNDPLTFTVVGTAPAGFSLNSNGTYTFDAANAAYNVLAAGQTQQVVINYSVADGKGGTAASTLTVNVTGTNDAPVAVADTGPAPTEGGAAVTGAVATNDSDPDQGAVLTYTLNAPVAGLTLNSNGTYSFDPANAAYNSLAAGQTRQVVASYTVTDAQGATATSTLTFTVTGTNDVPVAVAETAAGNEGAGTLTGSVATNDSDPDAEATLTYALNAPVPGLTLNANGTYSFNLNDPAYDALAADQTRQVVANYTVSDGQGGTATSTLTITVTGTNDAPIAVDDTAAGVEDTEIRGNVGANDTDVDAGATKTFAVMGTAPGGFVLNADGSFVLDTRNAAYQNLREGQTQDVVVNYQLSDGQDGVDNGVLTITVTGRAEQVNLDVDTDDSLLTRAVFDADATDFAFTNDDDVAKTVVINNFGADDFITFDAPFNGSNAVSFASTDFDGDDQANDLVITANKGGVVSDIVIRNVVSANAVIFDEASAEAAVAGADNFRTTTQGTIVNQSLDVDNDSSLDTASVIDAGIDGFRFTDDADMANNVQIIKFGSDDRIVFETGANVSFVGSDADNDGLEDDLLITVEKGGVISEIALKDVIEPDAVVFNEVTANAAIGGGIDYFSFA
jgi:VCBS repeat-containing protein